MFNTDGQKDQRSQGIAHRPQQGGKIVVQKGRCDAAENHQQILPHHPLNLLWHLQKSDDGVRAGKCQQVQRHGQSGDQGKGGAHALL